MSKTVELLDLIHNVYVEFLESGDDKKLKVLEELEKKISGFPDPKPGFELYNGVHAYAT